MHVKTNTLVVKEKGVHPVYCTCRSQYNLQESSELKEAVVHKEEEERLHRLIKKLKTELQLSSQALKDKELENKDDRADDLNNIQKLLQRIKNLKLVREDLNDAMVSKTCGL